jgi:3-hydroxyisobutyrate dehydrogenase
MTQVVMVGCGEVGLAYAEGVRGTAPACDVVLLDPVPSPAALAFADEAELPLHQQAGPWLGAADLLLLATPGGALTAILDSLLPHLPAGTAIADMSTASAEAKQAAAERCRSTGVSYTDIAITGSVALGKAKTPLLYAGDEIPALVGLLKQLDAPLTILDGSRPGDAMRVKLLRSVIMKGLEGLAVECLPAAREYGVLDQLWASLADVDRTGFVPLLSAMVRTHPQHAARREHEVAQAAEQLERIGCPSTMTRATEVRFAATNTAMSQSRPTVETTEDALDWLSGVQSDRRP